MLGDISQWHITVERDNMSFDHRIFVHRRNADDEIEILCGDGTTIRVLPGQDLPDGAGIRLPSAAWEALVEHAAGASHLGNEVRVLREWLRCEQARVDSALDTARQPRI